MAPPSDQADKLRRQLDKAIEKDRHKEAIAALGELERLEPKEPRWPQRLGDLLRRGQRKAEAEVAYLRAMNLYAQQGFLPQAVALAKVVVALNPARAAILDQISQQATRELRRTLGGARRASAAFSPAAEAGPSPPAAEAGPSPPAAEAAPLVPAPRRERFLPRAAARPAAPPATVEAEPRSVEVDLGSLGLEVIEIEPESEPESIEPEPSSIPSELAAAVHAPPKAPPAVRARWGRTAEKHHSFIGGIPLEGMMAAARALEPADDVEHDEVRFSDVPQEEWIEVEGTELDGMRPVSSSPGEPTPDDWDAARLAALSGAALFADVSPEALGALARAAEVVELPTRAHVFRRGDEADGLYVIAEGSALVVQPWLEGGGIDLVAGQIFGEGCLLQGGKRQADVRAKDPLLLLRIAKAELSEIVVAHREVHQLLFDLLVQRLLANVLQTSSLFAAFELEQRKELANMFEVRWAAPEVMLQERGKRSDGLYLLLAGEFAEVVGERQMPLPLGTVIGYRSLLSHDPATHTIVTLTESVVLRMPAKRFGSFAVQFPPALAALANQGGEPDEEHR